MRAVDTNVLVRLFARDDPHQTTSAEDFIEPGAWVSVLALAETIWVLKSTYRLEARDIITVVETLLNNTRVTVQDRETVIAALELFRQRPSLAFSDCLIVELARKAGHLPLGTFDRALAKVEGTQKL